MAFCGPAHPRSRGENISAPASTPSMRGSSPLTRGKLDLVRTQVRTIGLIPAHAGKTRPGMPTTPSRPAHPRSRGENFQAKTIPARGPGSSPLTRGKRERRRDPIAGARLIPAHAGKTAPGPTPARGWAAHPRSRGENITWIAQLITSCGSSPLTRGKRVPGCPQLRADRLIPAHAGKTSRQKRFLRGGRAHPRSRGENVSDDGTQSRARGSSPLTRGKRSCGPWGRGRARLIPAHAGKTRGDEVYTLVKEAHPRSRGENVRKRSKGIYTCGSSPLTRGKPADRILAYRDHRLIPAHAGKTVLRTCWFCFSWAHPRSRGENGFVHCRTRNCRGSSPLTRGKLSLPVDATQAHRLIPAHAGKTRELWTRNSRPRAHPRSRGENIKTALGEYADDGSSPLTRGKRTTHSVPRKEHGLIPAHAGKTTPHTDHTPHTRAHPRSRGENSLVYPATESCSGSSPLTRGKRRDPVRPRVLGRLIPAHAGKTPRAHARASSSRAHPRSRGENSR